MTNPEFFGSSFANELYDTIYTGLENGLKETTVTNIIKDQLESPQKEQFIKLFIELSIKKEPLDIHYVLCVCHKLLEESQSRLPPVLRSKQIVGPNELHEQQLNVKNDRNGIGSIMDTKIQPKRLLQLSNVTRCHSHCTENNIKTDKKSFNAIANVEFMTKNGTELKRLHNVIACYVNYGGEHCGHVVKALKMSLKNEIDHYLHFSDNTWLRNSYRDALVERADEVGLRHTPVDHNDLDKLRRLAKIVQSVEDKSGCNLISSLVRSNCCETESAIFNEITKPIRKMIALWMTRGQVEDKFGEFFIVKSNNDYCCRDNCGHALSVTNTLDFLNERQLNEIYRIGENVGFLMKILGPKTNKRIECVREDGVKLADEDGLLTMLADEHSVPSTIVSEMCTKTSVLLLDVLKTEYSLFEYLEGFRSYVLLGRGDFYYHAMSQLERYFGDKVMNHYQLQDVVDDAYRLTSAKNDGKKLFDHLKYRIDSTEEVNWDSFQFEYEIDEPLNEILGPCFKHNANVFKFLWRTKYVDWATKKINREQNYFAKKTYNNKELKSIWRNVHSLQSSILGCVNRIQNFVFEEIDDVWKRFKTETSRATCVKTVTDAIVQVLESITKIADDASASLNKYVKSLKTNVEHFVRVFRRFVDTVDFSSENGKTWSYDEYRDETNTFMDSIKNIRNTYETSLRDFLLKLVGHETRELVALALRIDFNEYYLSNGASTSNRNLI